MGISDLEKRTFILQLFAALYLHGFKRIDGQVLDDSFENALEILELEQDFYRSRSTSKYNELRGIIYSLQVYMWCYWEMPQFKYLCLSFSVTDANTILEESPNRKRVEKAARAFIERHNELAW